MTSSHWTDRAMLTALFAIASLTMAAAPLAAQGVTSGAVAGTVTDRGGRPLEGVQIQVQNRQTGYSTGALTRANGYFLVQGLEVGGPYTVRARRIGYEAAERNDVFVRLSETTRADMQLGQTAVQLGTVEVRATVEATEFSPTRQGVGTTISDTLLRRMPNLTRDFTDLVRLTPQVQATTSQSRGPSAGGAYNRLNNFQIDGANQNDRFNLNSSGGQPGGAGGGRTISPEAVKEFRVLLTPTDVRQANFSGMLVNAVTRSGTNDFTGGAIYVFRNEAFNAQPLRGSRFDYKQYGFQLGGPIIRDRLHFFVAPEWQERESPSAGPSLGGTSDVALNISADSITRVQTLAQRDFEPGTAGSIPTINPLRNLFARVDWQVTSSTRVVLRQIVNRTENVSFSRNTAAFQNNPSNQNTGFRLGSNSFTGLNTNQSSVGQIFTNWGAGASNELLVGVNQIIDKRVIPGQLTPEIAVGVVPVGAAPPANTPTAVITLGTEQFSPGNRADQNILEVTDNFSMPVGPHTLTVGGRFETAKVYNFFAQTTGGYYIFPSITAFENRQPSGYRFAFDQSGTGLGIPAKFTTRMWSGYAQDQWAVNPRLTVTAGLRADVPTFASKPLENTDFDNTFNTAAAQTLGFSINTSVVPKTRVLWSPRVGFNLDVDGTQQNQIRGNVGIYTGNPPYILVGNQYANTGLGLVTITCTAATGGVPAFTTDVSQLRKACGTQPEPAPGSFGTAGINLSDPNFKFPQFFGTSLGFDRRLPGAVVFTFEGLYRRAINGMFIRDLNLRGPRMVNGEIYRDRNGRVLYADTINAAGQVTNNNQRYVTSYRNVSFAEGVIYLTNQSKDYNYSLTGQLRRRFGASLDVSASYTYMQSKDVQSLTSDRAISNWRNGRELSGLENEAVATNSYFERPHRILAYGTWTMPWQLTDVSFIVEGRSGLGITYTAAGDLNGDLGTTNDPIYVPRDATDINEIRIGTQSGTGVFTQNVAAAQAFEQFIASQSCLDKQRGSIMKRGSCRSPWQRSMDVAIRQRLPRVQGQQVSLQLDVFNFPNLLNKRWGQYDVPRLNNNFPGQSVLSITGRTPGPINQSQPVYTYNATVMNGGPWVRLNNAQNNYQLQLTARYAF